MIPSSIMLIGNNVFYECENINYVIFLNETSKMPNINKTQTIIGDYAFFGCKSIKFVKFLNESSIQSIGKKAFSHCSSLESFLLPSFIKSIEEKTFYNCSKLTSFIIPKNSSLISIGIQAFGSCNKLESFELPKDVNSIGIFAFEHCIKLKKFYYYGIKEPIIKDSFSGCIDLNEIYVTNSYLNNSFGDLKINVISSRRE